MPIAILEHLLYGLFLPVRRGTRSREIRDSFLMVKSKFRSAFRCIRKYPVATITRERWAKRKSIPTLVIIVGIE